MQFNLFSIMYNVRQQQEQDTFYASTLIVYKT